MVFSSEILPSVAERAPAESAEKERTVVRDQTAYTTAIAACRLARSGVSLQEQLLVNKKRPLRRSTSFFNVSFSICQTFLKGTWYFWTKAICGMKKGQTFVQKG